MAFALKRGCKICIFGWKRERARKRERVRERESKRERERVRERE
jgi:hypothetical protein